MTRVAILDDYQGIALECGRWSDLPDDVEIDVYRDNIKDADALVERLGGYEVLVIMRERTLFPRELIERLPDLKLLITTSGRNRGVDLDACKDHGVLVCCTESGNAPTAELAWGMMLALALAKQITVEDRETRDGRWGVTPGIGLTGRTLGVMGLGKIGKKVAAVGLLFDMRVIAWSPNMTAELAAEVGAELVDKQTLLRESDFLTIHLGLGDSTRGLIGADDLALMKSSAYLINTSRGPIVDEAALIQAVTSGGIAGAGLDVFDVEPLPADHPLRSLPNSVITPHVGGFIRENYELWYQGAVEDIAAWLAGKPIRVLSGSA